MMRGWRYRYLSGPVARCKVVLLAGWGRDGLTSQDATTKSRCDARMCFQGGVYDKASILGFEIWEAVRKQESKNKRVVDSYGASAVVGKQKVIK